MVECKNCKKEVDQKNCYVVHNTNRMGYNNNKIITYECAKDTKKCKELFDNLTENKRKEEILENIEKLTKEKERRDNLPSPFIKKERPIMLTRMACMLVLSYGFYSNKDLDQEIESYQEQLNTSEIDNVSMTFMGCASSGNKGYDFYK